MCRLAGDAFSVGSHPGLCQWVEVSPIGQPRENHSSLTPLFRLLAEMNQFYLLPAGNYFEDTGLFRTFSLAADSPPSHGGRECLMRLMAIITFVAHQA